MNKQRALVLGIIAGFVVVAGITISALLYKTTAVYEENMINEEQDEDEDELPPINKNVKLAWLFGLVYFIPGIIGLIAALSQNKCMYVTTSIFSIICIIIMTILVAAAALLFLGFIVMSMNMSDSCKEIDGNFCMCRDREHNYSTKLKSCGEVKALISMALAIMAFVVLAWVGVVAQFIVVIFFLCKSKPRGGTVLVPAQQPMLPPEQFMAPSGYEAYPLPAKV